MENFKARAWDRYRKEMYSFEELGGMEERNEISFHALLDGIYSEIKTQLYTGLKDKEGNEIYEGDILEADSNGTMLGDTFYTGFQGYDRRIVVEDIRKIRFWKYTDKIKVVGNIYENPVSIEE